MVSCADGDTCHIYYKRSTWDHYRIIPAINAEINATPAGSRKLQRTCAGVGGCERMASSSDLMLEDSINIMMNQPRDDLAEDPCKIKVEVNHADTSIL